MCDASAEWVKGRTTAYQFRNITRSLVSELEDLSFTADLTLISHTHLHTQQRKARFSIVAHPFSFKYQPEENSLFVGCLTSQQHASVSQGRICSDNFTCCHTEIEVADQTFHLTQSQYTDTGPISPSTDPITLGAWQGSHWSANF